MALPPVPSGFRRWLREFPILSCLPGLFPQGSSPQGLLPLIRFVQLSKNEHPPALPRGGFPTRSLVTTVQRYTLQCMVSTLFFRVCSFFSFAQKRWRGSWAINWAINWAIISETVTSGDNCARGAQFGDGWPGAMYIIYRAIAQLVELSPSYRLAESM